MPDEYDNNVVENDSEENVTDDDLDSTDDTEESEEDEEIREPYKKHYFYPEQILSSDILNEMDDQLDYLSNNFDYTPTEGSVRYVISSGIKKYVDDIVEEIANARY